MDATSIQGRLASWYFRVLDYPWLVLVFVILLSGLASYHARDFSFDASSEDLVVQGDPKLAFYRKMSERFGGDDFLVVTYANNTGDLLSDASLARIAAIQGALEAIDGVAGVFSILDAPLMKSPPVPLERLAEDYLTLTDPRVDKALAKKELTGSPLFRNYLISTDGDATALRIDLDPEKTLSVLHHRRDKLRAIDNPDEGQLEKLAQIEREYSRAREDYLARRDRLLDDVRAVRDRFEDGATMYLGGVPMVAADMITFVKRDLRLFGSTVVLLMMALLFLFFRRVRWVLLPMLISALTILFTTAFLGYFGKPVTVISANFISLLGIICISFAIHLIVRYRELLAEDPEGSYESMVQDAMAHKFVPCLYTALTTMLAFGSMMASGILPVEDFGWMMCLGIVISFVVTYLVFPAMMLVLGRGEAGVTLGQRLRLTEMLCGFARDRPKRLIAISGAVAVVAVGGLAQLSFNNRFIDYFAEDTEIRQGMEYIDRYLGGTVPFDVYLKFPPWEPPEADDPFATPADEFPERYWYTPEKLAVIGKLHDFTAEQAETGKVLSLATLNRIARSFNDGEQLTALETSAALGLMPKQVRQQLIEPYAVPASGYARVNARVRESGPYFPRGALIEDIRSFSQETLGMEVRVTGMMVLFNDMLERLYDSQIRTLGYLVLATFIMFSLLLRSIVLAVLALIPNVIAAAAVIGFMGYANIPMDMMTITIAAISVGIGVDDAIHYLHRFRQELRRDDDVARALKEAHDTIGRAMYFTSLVVIGGFSVLALSNFLPTVYFGILTALAMLLAMLANLTLLPSLLIVCLSRQRRQ